MPIPTLNQLYNPILQAIRELGGSASTTELNQKVLGGLNLTDTELAETTNTGAPKVLNNIAWARVNLRGVGLLDKSDNGVWLLTSAGREAGIVIPREITHEYNRRYAAQRRARQQEQMRSSGNTDADAAGVVETIAGPQLEQTWKEQLLGVLHDLSPDAFEHLCQRLLRQSGFIEVKVTGRTGDGGIDGVGLLRLHGLISFLVAFQCKRYQGTVGARDLRDFRGAIEGKADRGLFITTGTFTQPAQHEATKPGARLIDLLDGEQLVEKLKELELGVVVRKIEVEEVTVLPDWFKEI